MLWARPRPSLSRPRALDPLAYQWQKLSGNGSDLADCTTAAMALTNVQTSDEADYRVAVTNVDGATNSVLAHLYVIVPPRITKVTRPGTTSFIDTNTAGASPLFYRVGVGQ